MNNEPPARIIFEFLCNGKLSIQLEWPNTIKLSRVLI